MAVFQTKRETFQMRYLDWLRNGSEFHKVTGRLENGFRIVPANDTPECHQQFDQIVEAASVRSSAEGYSILAHRQHMHGGYEYDQATITIDE